MKEFSAYNTLSVHTYSANVTGDDLFVRFGNAIICGVTVGSNATDAISLLLGSNEIYAVDASATTPVNVAGTRETVWLRWPLSTRVVDSVTGTTNLLADVVAGSAVTVLYYSKQ